MIVNNYTKVGHSPVKRVSSQSSINHHQDNASDGVLDTNLNNTVDDHRFNYNVAHVDHD